MFSSALLQKAVFLFVPALLAIPTTIKYRPRASALITQKAKRLPTIIFEVVGGIVCACFFKPNHRLQLLGLAAQLGQLTVHARCYVPAPLSVLLYSGMTLPYTCRAC